MRFLRALRPRPYCDAKDSKSARKPADYDRGRRQETFERRGEWKMEQRERFYSVT